MLMYVRYARGDVMQETGTYELVKHYRKYWVAILALTLAGFIIGLIYNNFIQIPKYKSNATLIIIKNDESTNSKNSTIINNYIRLFKSRKVLGSTIRDLKINQSYESLVSSIKATNDTGTDVVRLSVSSDNFKTSQQTLDHAITIFKNEAKSLYKKDNIQIVDVASLETKPYNVNLAMQLLISTSIGFLLPVIVIFFIYDTDLDSKKKHKSPTILKKDSNAVSYEKNDLIETAQPNVSVATYITDLVFTQDKPKHPIQPTHRPTSSVGRLNTPVRRK